VDVTWLVAKLKALSLTQCLLFRNVAFRVWATRRAVYLSASRLVEGGGEQLQNWAVAMYLRAQALSGIS
jgi:hypothetical protein